MSANFLNTGIKQIINNVPAKTIIENSQTYVDYKVQSGYKILKDVMKFEGQIKFTPTTAPTAATTYNLVWKSDHMYRLIQNYLLKLNSNIEVKQWTDLSFLRYYQAYENIGSLPYEKVPMSITFAANQAEVVADFKILMPLWFIMPDMIGVTQSFILTEIYNMMQAEFKVGFVADQILSIKAGTTDFEGKIELQNSYIESASEFWIVPANYLASNSAEEALQKMGMLYKTNTIVQNFSSEGQNQYIKLMPTTQLILKDLMIVTRDSATGQRVDGLISRIKIADGDRPLVDVSPDYIREMNNERYNLSWDLYSPTNANSPDNQGILYGNNRIDTTIFGELQNAMLATGNWNQPYLFLDIQNLDSLQGDLQVSVYQSSAVVPQSVQQKANQYAKTARSV